MKYFAIFESRHYVCCVDLMIFENLVSGASVSKKLSSADIQAWAKGLGAEKSFVMNFSPVFLLPDPLLFPTTEGLPEKIYRPPAIVFEWLNGGVPGFEIVQGGVKVSFMDIVDDEILGEASRICEEFYLADLDEFRKEWVNESVKSAVDAGMEFERWLCKNDSYYLGKYVLGYDKSVFHLHRFMAATVENLPPGYRGLREFPRDAYKSTFMIITRMVQDLLINPNCRILIKSNVAGNAGNKIKEAKRHFFPGTLLANLFPEYVPRTKADEGSSKKWSSPAYTDVQEEGNYTAAGVGTSLTSQHFDKIYGDDFWDQKSVKNPEVMAKCRGEMDEIEYLLAAPSEGVICFTGTRFAHDDPSKNLIDNPEYHCVIASGITPKGRCLFPEQMTLAKFWAQNDSNQYVFSCQIMLNPTQDDQGIKRSWFEYISPNELRHQELSGEITCRTVILTDAAGTDKAQSDPVAAMVVKIDSKGRYSVIRYVRDKLSPNDFLDLVFSLYDKYLPEYVVTQKAPLEIVLKSFIEKRNKIRRDAGKRPVKFYEMSLGKRSKFVRMLGLQPYFQRRLIYFNRDEESVEELETEILSFPHNMSNDDGMDCLSELTDPVVGRIPKHKKPAPAPDVDYTPEGIPDGFSESEYLYRQHQASEVFKRLRGTGKRKKRGAA